MALLKKKNINDLTLETIESLNLSINNKDLTSFKKELSTLDIKLDQEITDIESVRKQWKTNPEFRNELISKYIAANNDPEFIISDNDQPLTKKSSELLAKRKNIIQDKLATIRGKCLDSPEFEAEFLGKLKAFMHNKLESTYNRILKAAEDHQKREIGLSEDKKTPFNADEIEPGLIIEKGNRLTIEKLKTKEGQKELAKIIAQKYYSNSFNASVVLDNDKLVGLYIDHQETLERTTKGALRQMVENKHTLEGKFLRFKKTVSQLNCALVTATFVVTTVATALALASIPVGGIGVVLIFLTNYAPYAGKALSSMGAHMLNNNNRASSTAPTFSRFFTLSYQKLMTDFYKYKAISLEKQIKKREMETTKLFTAHKDDKTGKMAIKKESTLRALAKAHKTFESNKQKLKEWEGKAKGTQDDLTEKAWMDFASVADLKYKDKKFDTLKSLSDNLGECDLSLLDPETKSFFQVQLGIDLNKAQEELNQPDFQAAIKSFHTQSDTELSGFIKEQYRKHPA